MKVGLIGCGLMGRNRARALSTIGGHTLAGVFDPDGQRSRKIASDSSAEVMESWQAVTERPDIDAVLVAVPHRHSREICIAALHSGKHVLCEKPLGLSVRESDEILAAVRPGQVLAVGFNYRFYPGIQLARKLLQQGQIGELTHVRAALGHGARPGYEREWKTSKLECGGGALLDPGIHMLDLVQFFAGEIHSADAMLSRVFWPIDVEDNAFVNIRAGESRLAQLHISITEWRSRFAFDLFGTAGYIKVRGRCGFYGPQVVRQNTRWPWLESPEREESRWEFPLEDTSFAAELAAFFNAIETGHRGDLATGQDGLEAMKIIEFLYSATPIQEPSATANAAAAI
jgi:predicted dehydrogenase